MAENYLQHAEHYYRIMAAQQAQLQQYQQQQALQQQQPRAAMETANGNGGGDQPYVAPQPAQSAPSFSLAESEEEGEEEAAE
ncbi:MAG: DUF4167 domain-containing protein [Rhizomicrobium sp.]